jgi:hypothetical protein
MSSRLDDELRRLVSAGVLRLYQARAIRAAADADAEAIRRSDQTGRIPLGGRPYSEPAVRRSVPPREKPRSSALIEILGYIGGVLLLGAVGLLTIANWSLMSRGERVTTAVVAAALLLVASVVLTVARGPEQPASALAALGACVSGFAASVMAEGTTGRVAGVLVSVAFAGAGLWLLRGASLLVAMFASLAVGVFVVVFDLIDTTGSRTDTAGMAGAGFLLVAVILALLGLVRDRVTAWSLAGAAAFGSSMCWLVQDRGELMALAVGTAGSAALLIAYATHRAAAYAVVGCAILLVVWPTGLYNLTEDLAGVAIGLVVASGALIGTVVVLSRRQHRPAGSP